MPAEPTKNALPALDRGLHLLDQLIRSDGPVRYNELRTQLPGIQDSTLSRILKALETYGYISRDPDQGYSITQQVRDWSAYLSTEKPDLKVLAQQEVDRLVEEGQESAAVVQLMGDRIITLCSRTVSGGIQVLGPDNVLHYEADHAAAVGILAALPAHKRKACLQSTMSRFPAKFAFRSILQNMQQADGSLMDRSEQRPGVCRIANVFRHGDQIGAVFYCLTIEAAQTKQTELSLHLEQAIRRLSGD